MSNGPYYQGGCKCGAVTLIVTLPPLARGRDEQGQTWLVLDAETVKMCSGLEALDEGRPVEGRISSHCRHCHSHVLDELSESRLALLHSESLPAMEDIDAPLPDDELSKQISLQLYRA